MTMLERLQEQGLVRQGDLKRGFKWKTPKGKRLPERVYKRVRALKLPPAWQEVHVDPSPKARLQAVGKDRAGRWQYRYGEEAVTEREHKKFSRLIRFADALPQMRKAIERDLALPGLPREKVLACALRIMSTCFLRPGSAVYAKENGSFGVMTLQNRHVQVKGDLVHFDFMGKSKKRQVRELKDRRMAKLLAQLKALPGTHVFQWVEPDGSRMRARRTHLNQYIKSVMGEQFSAKDFRTWAGTMICACSLARAHGEMIPGRTSAKKVIAAAIKETSEHLGNTPAVCRASYVSPSVIAQFEKGNVVKAYFSSLDELIAGKAARARRVEKALVELVKAGARLATPAPTKTNSRMRLNKGQKALARAFTVH